MMHYRPFQWGADVSPYSGGQFGMWYFQFPILYEMACPLIQHITSTQRPIVYCLEAGDIHTNYFGTFSWDTAIQTYPESGQSYWMSVGY